MLLTYAFKMVYTQNVWCIWYIVLINGIIFVRLIMTIKREKFVTLAEKRVAKALKTIQLVGNLSNKSNYEYTAQDVQKIHKALSVALEEMQNRFSNSYGIENNVFKL